MNIKVTLPPPAATLFSLVFLLSFLSCEESKDSTEKPEDNRFTKVVLTEGKDEPIEMTFLPRNRILLVERKGGVKIFDENTGIMRLVATLPVNTKYTNKEGVVREAEEGLTGVIAHPDFEKNSWIYMYYADPVEDKHVLAPWELRGDSLYFDTRKIVLEVPTQRQECCQPGGGMVFDREGNLFLTVGTIRSIRVPVPPALTSDPVLKIPMINAHPATPTTFVEKY
jgi:cytochrome c